jgi:tetratricopeptide (TPR) repeat protein
VPEARLDFERFEAAMLERDYAGAARYLARVPAEAYAQEDYGIGTHPKEFHEALLAIASGSAPSRQEQALKTAERAVQSAVTPTGYYDETRSLADLALIHALLGRKKEAVGEAFRAIDVMERAAGTIEKNTMSSALALVYARSGEAEKALDLIEHLLTVPCELHGDAIYNMTLTDLKWRWLWDPLRSNPRFQKLLAGPEPKTNY